MRRIKIAALTGLLSLFASVLAQAGPGYPARLGAVNDYAHKLDQAQVDELTTLIKQYQQQTSIEFVVVIVNSLEGKPVGEYASGLGDTWGVGQAERNNGVVLLWAPRERAYSLRIADGLTPDLSDADARLLTTQHLLPYFKRGEYYTGLKETVLTTMKYLGDDPWEQRLQARGQAGAQEKTIQQQSAEEEQKSAEASKRFILIFIPSLAVIILAGTVIKRIYNRKTKLDELAAAGGKITGYLNTAENNAREIQALLDNFAREMPEQDLSALRDSAARQPERILKLKVDLQCLNLADLNSYSEMVRVRSGAETEAGLLESTKQQIARIRQAKEQSQALLHDLSQEHFQITDVRDSSRIDEVKQHLSEGWEDYQRAQQNSSMSVLDWLIINQLLNNSQTQVRRAIDCSQQAPYVAPSTTSFWSSSSDSGFFSSSSGGGGGGGGFSSGSGSDGSY